MHCKACDSANLVEFPAEINIQFPGKENLEKPSVWVFPKLLVCRVCGFIEFRIPDAELRLLADDTLKGPARPEQHPTNRQRR